MNIVRRVKGFRSDDEIPSPKNIYEGECVVKKNSHGYDLFVIDKKTSNGVYAARKNKGSGLGRVFEFYDSGMFLKNDQKLIWGDLCRYNPLEVKININES